MEALQQMAAIVMVFGLLGGALWWLRRRGLANSPFPSRRTGRGLESLERLVLGPQHVLYLVRFQDRILLLASSPAGCSLLDQSPSPRVGNSDGCEVKR